MAPPGITVGSPAQDEGPEATVAPLHGDVHAHHRAGGQLAFGSLTWIDKRGHAVRSPIAVSPWPSRHRPRSRDRDVGLADGVGDPGYTGTLTAAVPGLVGADVAT